MNETIGVKGGHNDRRRTMIITKEELKKLHDYQQQHHDKELEELEKKVKTSQRLTLIKTLPIAIAGQVYSTLTRDVTKEKELALQEVITRLNSEALFSNQETDEIITALKNGTLFSLPEELLARLGISLEAYKRTSEIDLEDFATNQQEKENSEEQLKAPHVTEETKAAIFKVVELTINEKEPALNEEELAPVEDTRKKSEGIETTLETQVTDTYIENSEEDLTKLKNHKIVDEYENKLKDVRADLRKLIFEYNLINDESNTLYKSKEAEELLDKLNELIKKIDQLKQALDIPNIAKYDDNYLYTLVADYIEEFHNKNFVAEIKDSSLYIMISEKLSELDAKKDDLQTKIETRKSKLELDEERFNEIRESCFNYEKFNNDILKFQAEQDRLLDDIRDKMAKATTVQERVEVQVRGMTNRSRVLLAMLGAHAMMPGARSARSMATMAVLYMYFMRNAMAREPVKRRYKSVNVTDYHKEIESSLNALDNISTLLSKTSHQIDSTIRDFEREFKEYLSVLPECRELLANLEKVKLELEEKEYELNRIKHEQEENLEKNDSKVKRITLESM